METFERSNRANLKSDNMLLGLCEIDSGGDMEGEGGAGRRRRRTGGVGEEGGWNEEMIVK